MNLPIKAFCVMEDTPANIYFGGAGDFGDRQGLILSCKCKSQHRFDSEFLRGRPVGGILREAGSLPTAPTPAGGQPPEMTETNVLP